MNIIVLTDKNGEVLATVRQPKEAKKDGPKFGLLARDPGHKVYEIELPDPLEKMTSVEEFHRALKGHLGKSAH